MSLYLTACSLLHQQTVVVVGNACPNKGSDSDNIETADLYLPENLISKQYIHAPSQHSISNTVNAQ
jgi:hypothetical protein